MTDLRNDLESSDPAVRRRACVELSRIADPPADLVGRVIALLDDPGSEEVESEPGAPPFYYSVAAEAAATLRAWGAQLPVAEPLLWNTFARGTPYARKLAALLLARFGEPALARIAAVLATPTEHEQVRLGCTEALASALKATNPQHAELLAVLLRTLDDEQRNTVWAAHVALDALGNRWAAQPAGILAALARITDLPRVIVSIEARTQVFETRYTAIAALGHFLGVPEAATVLSRIALDSKADLDHASASLGRLGPVLPDATVDQLVATLVALPIKSISPRLLDVLATYGTRARGAAHAVAAAFASEAPDDSAATKQATTALWSVSAAALRKIDPGSEITRTALIEVFLHGDHAHAKIARALIEPAGIPVTVVLELASRLADLAHRAKVLRVLPLFGADALPALPALLLLLDGSFRAEALRVIAAIGPAARPGAEILLEVLAAEHGERPQVLRDITNTLAALRK